MQPYYEAPHPLFRPSRMFHSKTGLSCSLLPFGTYIVYDKDGFVNRLQQKPAENNLLALFAYIADFYSRSGRPTSNTRHKWHEPQSFGYAPFLRTCP